MQGREKEPEMQKSTKKDRMIGSLLALILGVSGYLGALARAAQGEDASIVGSLSILLGAVAYRSRKRRLLGLQAENRARVGFELSCLVLLTIAWLALRDLGTQIIESPVEHLVIPIWALVAYACAGLRIRPETSEGQRQAPESGTNGPAVLVLALVLGATGAHALREQGTEIEPEPGRPPQTALDAVRPLGLCVSMGDHYCPTFSAPQQHLRVWGTRWRGGREQLHQWTTVKQVEQENL